MQYKIVVDKQPSSKPSNEKREYIIETEELKIKGSVYDSINITPDKTYVTRRLALSEYGVLNELEPPQEEEFENLNVELFEGDNYIYVYNMQGNKICAEYIIKNDFTEDFATKNEMNTAIKQSAQSIELNVNQTLTGYATKTEMNSAIELNSNTIMLEVNKKVGEDEIGTKIEQNAESVKIAWNNESQNIKLENDNGNSTMGFYDNAAKFAEMGVNNVENDRYISFAIPCDYGEDIADGMAWGIQTTSDNKFWPILYVKDFHMANKNAGDFSGQLVLTACTLNLEGINSAITCGNVNMTNAGVFGGIMFEDANTHQNLLTVTPEASEDYGTVGLLDKISFFRNEMGTNTLRVGLQSSNNCLLTDEGYIACNQLYVTGDIYTVGQVSASHFDDRSTLNIKKNIKKYNKSAINEILNTEIYEFNYKIENNNDKKTIGAIIDKSYKCSEDILNNNGNAISLYSMISVAYKAIQEQQVIIKRIEKKVGVI